MDLVPDHIGVAPHWYRAGARELERQTRRGVGVGGSHRGFRGHGRRAATLSARLEPIAGRCRVGSERRRGCRRRRVRRLDDDHSAGADTRARVWPRGRSRQRNATDDHDHGRCVFGRDRQRHAQNAPADILNAGQRRPSPGVSAACWLDVGALRSWIRHGVAGAANRRGRARIDGTGGYRHDRDDGAAPAPSQAAGTRSAPELRARRRPVIDGKGSGDYDPPAQHESLTTRCRGRAQTHRISVRRAHRLSPKGHGPPTATT